MSYGNAGVEEGYTGVTEGDAGDKADDGKEAARYVPQRIYPLREGWIWVSGTPIHRVRAPTMGDVPLDP